MLGKFSSKGIASPHKRAVLVSFFTEIFAFFYHFLICITFFKIKVYPMFFFNFFSVGLYFALLLRIEKEKTFVRPYLIAVVEVVAHQVLATYYLGTDAKFYYFILLMGLLPFTIFEEHHKFGYAVTLITSVIFVYYENIFIYPKYMVPSTLIRAIKMANISITIFSLFFVILIFTSIVFIFEKKLRKQNTKLQKEINMGASIQKNFFKSDISQLKEFDISYFSKPMLGVSGDFLDFYKTGKNLEGFGIFDVSGHGISSGLVTMLVKNIIVQEFYDSTDLELWEIMNKINDRFIAEKGDIENYLTGVLMRIEKKPAGYAIEFVNAGHPSPIIYRAKDDSCHFLEKKRSSIGAIGFSGFTAIYKSEKFFLEEGDELFLYSDGVTDLVNASNEKFGNERLFSIIKEIHSCSTALQSEVITQRMQDFSGKVSQPDDISFIIIKSL